MTPEPTRAPSVRRGFSPVESASLGLFFLSGASALVYEVVWSRDLTNVFGASAFAIATVLAAFMAGLALGSATFGRLVDRRRNPLAVYALLEGGIAIWALVIPSLFDLTNRLYAGLYRALDPGFYTLTLLRFVLSFLILLVPTTLMGGTLPVLGKFLITQRERIGERAGLLYGANTLGAVLGTAVAGFFLLPALGLERTTLTAVLINASVAALAFGFSRRLAPAPVPPVEPPPGPSRTPDAVQPAASPALARAVLWAYAASGFAALGYEVAWTKTLSSVLGTTTYAFTSMLTTFLLGLALGSLVFSKLADRTRRPEILLVLVQIGIPLLTLGTIPVFPWLPQLFLRGFAQVGTHWFALELYRILLAAAPMFLPTLLMGGMFPLVTRVYLGTRCTATRLGRLYAANTWGAIAGSLAAGFLLIPWIGSQHSILAAALVNVAAAVLLLVVVGRSTLATRWRWAFAGLAVLFLPAAAVALRPWDPHAIDSAMYVYAQGTLHDIWTTNPLKASTLLYRREGAEAPVSVWSVDYTTFLRINGKVDASSHGDMVTQRLLGHLPELYHRPEAKRALVIGLASGISSGTLLTYPVDSVDTVELNPAVPGATRFFERFNHHCLEDPRHRVILADARNYLLLTDRTYDLMVSEPSNPWISGITSLFTREFFELAKAHLRPGGVISIWMQAYQFHPDDMRTALATIADVFPYLHVWAGEPGDIIVVAGREPLVLDMDRLRTILSGPPGQDLASLSILPPAQLLAYFETDRDGVESFIGDWPRRVTDDNLYLEYAVPRHMFQTEDVVNATTFWPVERPVSVHLAGSGIDSTLIADIGRFREARKIAVRAHRNQELPAGTATLEEAFRHALAIAPGERYATAYLAGALNETAIRFLETSDTTRAETTFQEVVALGSEEEGALALNNLGAIAYARRDLDRADAFWERALRDEPDHPSVLYNLAVLADRHNRDAEAMGLYRRVVARQADNSAALNNLAYLLARQGKDLDRAEDYARRAVALDPSANNRDTLGLVLVKRRAWAAAERVLAPIVKDDSRAWESVYHLALARAGRGDAERARTALEQIVNESPDQTLVAKARDAMKGL